MEAIWIGVIGVLGGALIGVLGQILGNWINHKKELERIRTELVLKEKIESFKKIHKLISQICKDTINFLIKKEGNKSTIKDLISKLNHEVFLFSNQKTLVTMNNNTEHIYNLLNNPPKIINQEACNKLVDNMGVTMGDMIKCLREELKI